MTTDAVGSASNESFQEANISSPTENSDILGIIFPRLPPQDLLRASRVSRKWHIVAQKELFSEARSLEALKTYQQDTAEKQQKTRRMVTQCLRGLRGKPEARLQAFRTEAARILVAQLPQGVPEDDLREKSSERYQRRLYPLNSIFMMLEVVFDENYQPENNPNSGYQFEYRPPYVSVFEGLANLGLMEEVVKAVQKTTETLEELNVVIPNSFGLESEIIRMAERLAFQGRKEALQLIDKLQSIVSAINYELKSKEILNVLIKLGKFGEIDLAEEILKRVVGAKYSVLIELAVLQHRPELLDKIKPHIAALEEESLKESLMKHLELTQKEMRKFNQALETARKIIDSNERFRALGDLAEQEAQNGKIGSALKCLELISGEDLDRYRVRVANSLEKVQIEDKYQGYRTKAAEQLMEKVTDPEQKASYEENRVKVQSESKTADSYSVFDPAPVMGHFVLPTFFNDSDEDEVPPNNFGSSMMPPQVMGPPVFPSSPDIDSYEDETSYGSNEPQW